MNKVLPIILIAVAMLASCGEKKEDAQKALLDKVMKVHDEVMPLMGDIMKYKKELNTRIDELLESGVEEQEAQIAELKKAVEELENSHEGMMSWMRQFDSDFEGKVEEEVMAYLKDQMTKIESVGKETNAALRKAEQLLKK